MSGSATKPACRSTSPTTRCTRSPSAPAGAHRRATPLAGARPSLVNRDARRTRLLLALLVALSLTLVTLDYRAGGGGLVGKLRSAAAAVIGPPQRAVAAVVHPVGTVIGSIPH